MSWCTVTLHPHLVPHLPHSQVFQAVRPGTTSGQLPQLAQRQAHRGCGGVVCTQSDAKTGFYQAQVPGWSIRPQNGPLFGNRVCADVFS